MTIKVHSSNFCRLTPEANSLIQKMNYEVRRNELSICEAGELLGLSASNSYRYYYGCHSYNPGHGKQSKSYTQVRLGAHCVLPS